MIAPPPSAESREVVSVEELSKRYGETWALREVAFSLAPRQVVGLLGPNGAGKTTLLEILEGVRRPSSGTVRLFGTPLEHRCYPKRRVGAVFQAESCLEGMRVIDYARLYASIYGVPRGEQAILSRARLEERAATPVADLSGGQAQRLYIAAAVVHGPELLFLDEPTAHLDPATKLDLGRFVRELAAAGTVILATHDLREAESVCDTVLFLAGGELKAQGSPEALIASVPASARGGEGLEDAFFYYCHSRIASSGEPV
jgi:ABC-2 type transport system ATP-binding protein